MRAKHLHAGMKEDDVMGAAAELAFRLFLAVFPFFIFLAALGGFAADLTGLENPTDEIMDVFGDQLPADTRSVLYDELDQVIDRRDPTLLSIGVIGALWAAAGGIGTVMKAANRAYDARETRPFLMRTVLAVLLTALAGLLLISAFILFVVGQVYGLELADELGLEGFTATLLNYARWPLVAVLALTATAFLYWRAPNRHLPFRWITPGAVFFVVGWLLVSYGFTLYVSHFGSYNATYGTLGGVVVTLTWFYLTSLILLTGIEINAVFAREAGVVEQGLPVGAGEPIVEPAAATPRPTGFRI